MYVHDIVVLFASQRTTMIISENVPRGSRHAEISQNLKRRSVYFTETIEHLIYATRLRHLETALHMTDFGTGLKASRNSFKRNWCPGPSRIIRLTVLYVAKMEFPLNDKLEKANSSTSFWTAKSTKWWTASLGSCFSAGIGVTVPREASDIWHRCLGRSSWMCNISGIGWQNDKANCVLVLSPTSTENVYDKTHRECFKIFWALLLLRSLNIRGSQSAPSTTHVRVNWILGTLPEE